MTSDGCARAARETIRRLDPGAGVSADRGHLRVAMTARARRLGVGRAPDEADEADGAAMAMAG